LDGYYVGAGLIVYSTTKQGLIMKFSILYFCKKIGVRLAAPSNIAAGLHIPRGSVQSNMGKVDIGFALYVSAYNAMLLNISYLLQDKPG
jgi:hypothetical protein